MSARATLLVVAIALVLAALNLRAILPDSFEINSAADDPIEVMTAVRYRAHGAADEVLEVDESVPRPAPLPGQVLVRVAFAALNPCDFKFRRNGGLAGFVVPKPKVPGADVSGVVVGAGESSRFKRGDRVAAMLPLLGTR